VPPDDSSFYHQAGERRSLRSSQPYLSKVQQFRERMNKWDYINLKIFCKTKDTVPRLKRLSIEWEKIFAGCSSKALISRVYRSSKTQPSKN
jgi:hypothetical protein